MIAWWVALLMVAAAAGGSWLVTLRSLPRMIARMSDAQRNALLDQVEAIERGTK